MARSSCILAFAVLALLSPERVGSGQDAISWMTDLQAAQNAAARQGKLVLVHFYSDNCPPCKTLEKSVFSQAHIAAAINRNYLPVKVHVNSWPEVAARYQVQAWPTDLIVTSAGLEVYRTISPQSAAQYQLMLDQVAFQSGVGASRQAADSLAQSTVRGEQPANVALTGAAIPMGQTGAAGPGAQTSQQGYSAPPYNEYTVGGGAPAPNIPQSGAAGRYGGQDLRQGRADTYQAAAQPAIADRWAGLSHGQPPIATPPATEESIYAGAMQDSAPAAGPPPGPSQNRWPQRPSTTQTPAPARNAYDPIFSQRPSQPAPQLPPQRSAQPSSAPPVASAQRTSAQFPAPRTVSATEAPPLSIDGFCPVTLLESTRWQKGSVNWGAVHRGRTYLFISPEAQRQFLADPDRYAPVLSGCDPVIFAETNQLISGSHSIGLLMGGKTFFFASEESLARFELAPHVYMGRAYQAMSASHVTPR